MELMLLLFAALCSTATAQLNPTGAALSWTITYSYVNQDISLSNALSSASSSWQKSVTTDNNWSALISAVPADEASQLSVYVTADPTGSGFFSAARALETWPTTAATVPGPVQSWFASAENQRWCGTVAVIKNFGGVIAAQTGFSCPNAATTGRLTSSADAWLLTVAVFAASSIAGAALLL